MSVSFLNEIIAALYFRSGSSAWKSSEALWFATISETHRISLPPCFRRCPTFADPATGCPRRPRLAKVLSAGAFATVNRLGESDQEAALREGKLLSHHRTTDPFGITVRGPFKGLPPVAEQPAAVPAQPVLDTGTTPSSQVVAPPSMSRPSKKLLKN